MSDQKSENKENAETDATPYILVKKRQMVRHLQEIIETVEDKDGKNEAAPCGFLHITFFDNGDNNTLIAGEYNPILLYGTFFDTILKMRENLRDADVKRMIEEGMGLVEKTLSEGRTDN